MQRTQQQQQPEPTAPFKLDLIEPYSTYREDGTPTPTPFLVDGLLTEGGLSVLGAKPKVGKSSLARYLAVATAKGTEFLGRTCTRGDVLLCSLEDPLSHVDNCLGAVGYEPETDGRIHIVKEVPIDHNESVGLLREELTKNAAIRLVIIDHLADFLNVPDLSDYVPVKRGVNLLLKLAREFPRVHIMILAHAKKIRTEDPFDALLGSTALRSVPDTNIVIQNERGNRVIVSETRVGRAIPATILVTDMVTRAGSDVVQGYSLGGSFDQLNDDRKEKAEQNQSFTYTNRILDYLNGCEDHMALQSAVLDAVTGKTARVLEAIRKLEADSILGSKDSPKTLFLNVDETMLRLYQSGRKDQPYVN